jgi:hypothetical protein
MSHGKIINKGDETRAPKREQRIDGDVHLRGRKEMIGCIRRHRTRTSFNLLTAAECVS